APNRDPFARELRTPFPGDCIVGTPDFPWHDTGYVKPQFSNFVIYQPHVGTFFTPNLPKGGTFLDVTSKIPHLVELGVTAIQLMPIQEFQTAFSLGYNGTDYFSPEMDFAVAAEIRRTGPARRDESAQGADRPVPHTRAGRAAGRGIHPRGRRFWRPEHVL